MKKPIMLSAMLAAAISTPAAAAYSDMLYQTRAPWKIYAVFDNGKYWQCAAEIHSGNNRMRLIKFSANDSLIIATPTRRTKMYEGGLAFNGVGDAVKYSVFNGWGVYSTTDSYIYDMLPQGRQISVDPGDGYISFSLSGVEGVLSTLRTCASKQGKGGQPMKFNFSVPKPVFCAAEGQLCRFTGSKMVIYGYGNQTIRKVMKGPVMCTNQAMGGDPAYNVKKSCQIQ